MTDKTVPLLVLCSVAMGLLRTNMLGAEGLPPRALARLGGHQLYHGPGVGCAALSADEKRVASAANHWDANSEYVRHTDQEEYNRIIVLWDAVSGERLHELRVLHSTSDISYLTFSPDGKSLAAAYERVDNAFEVAVFAVETGKLLRRIEHFTQEINSVRFSLDGKQLYVGEQRGAVSAWDTSTGKQLRRWKPPPDEPAASDKKPLSAQRGTLSPDGKVIAWEMGYRDVREGANYRSVVRLRVHDAAMDQFLYGKNAEPQQSFGNLVFSADGKRLAISREDTLLVWDAATGKNQRTIEERWVFGFALTPDGHRAVVFVDPEEDAAASGEDKRERTVRYVETGKPPRRLALGFVDPWWDLPVSGLPAFSADGKTLLLASPPTLRLFDTTTGKERFRPRHFAPVLPRFSSDGRALFTSCFVRRCRWDVSGTPPALVREEPRQSWDDGIAYSDDGRLLLDSSETPMRLREAATGRVLRELEGAVRTDFGLFSPDASKVLLGTNDYNHVTKVWLYDVKTGKATGAIAPEDRRGLPIFSPNGRQVAWANSDGSVHLYDAVTGKRVRTLRSSKPLPEADIRDAQILFCPDGERLIVTTYDTSVSLTTPQPTRVFQVCSGREILRFHANPEKTNKADPLSHMACSPDGRLLAVAEKYSGTVRLIELATGAVRAELAGHRHGIHGLAFAPNGETLASGGLDPVVFLWDVTGARTPAVKTERDSDLASWWNDLDCDDGRRAGAAIAGLLRRPEASAMFLQQHLHPEETPSEKRLRQLIADLDADVFKTREAASDELTRLAERAESALRRELTNRPSLEMRRRIEVLFDKLESHTLPPRTLRALRAIEVLEHIGTPAARHCLEALAKGAADARQTQDAKSALQRLANRR